MMGTERAGEEADETEETKEAKRKVMPLIKNPSQTLKQDKRKI